ncbi:MAG: type 4a pilus biogenesis protein PilO [Candidatus Methylomirabilia bacterium]
MAFEFITEAPRSQQVAFGVMFLIAIVGGGYYFLLSPSTTRVKQLRAEHASLQKQIIENRAIAAHLARFRQEATALRKRLDAVRARLPTEKEIPRLYRQVSDLARRSGLAVSLFDPGSPENREFYEETPIVLVAETSYHRLGEFFARLARLPRIVTLNKFRFQGIDDPTATLRAELTLATYLMRPKSEASADQPGAPPGNQQ